MIHRPHAILVRVDLGPGEHWDCVCGGWRFDWPDPLDVHQVSIVLNTVWDYHLKESDGLG